MKENALVSVIIPAYNAEKYIEETIRSVLAQTHSYLEIIVVDDGSTDKTPKLVETICKDDTRIQLIKQKNSGVSAARNKGFSISNGSYIAYLDADDLWAPNFLELTLLKFSSDISLGLVHSDYQVLNENLIRSKKIYSGKEGYILDHLLLGGEEKYIFGICGVLLKKETIEKVGGFDTDLSNGADHEFYFRVANCYKIGRVPEVTWYYRYHSNNMHSNINLFEKDVLTAYKKADEYGLFKDLRFRKECYSNIYLILAGSWWKNGKNKIKGSHYILKSIITYPPNVFKLLKKVY